MPQVYMRKLFCLAMLFVCSYASAAQFETPISFMKLDKFERQVAIEELWRQRYEIIESYVKHISHGQEFSEYDDLNAFDKIAFETATNAFFEAFYNMLCLDRDLSILGRDIERF